MSPTSPSSSGSSTGSSPGDPGRAPIGSLHRRLGGLQAGLIVDLALRRGLIRREDLDRCLDEVRADWPILAVLLEKKLLSEERVESLARDLKAEDLKELVVGD